MTTLRGTAGHAPAPARHRPAAGARQTRPDGRTATLRRIVASRQGRELVTFGVIGLVSTGAYAVLYLLLRTATGPTAANALALVVTAIGNTAANRRLTFGVRDDRSMVRDQIGGLVALAIALAITTSSVSLLGALAPRAGRMVELAVLVVANALATVARFVLLRSWITADRERALASASHNQRPGVTP
jgi:putative flippase GtrA